MLTPDRDEKKAKKKRKNSTAYLKYTGMAFEMFAIMGLFTYGGIKLDAAMETNRPYFMLLGAVLGTTAALIYTLRDFIFTKTKK